MRLLWNFNGSAARYAARVQGLYTDNFQTGIDGALALPGKGDLLKLKVSGIVEPAQFVCTGRRFDLSENDGPVMRIDLELAPMVSASRIPADPTPASAPRHHAAPAR